MFRKKSLLLQCLLFLFIQQAIAQNSLLVNFGLPTCNEQGNPSLFIIKDPLATNPVTIYDCNLNNQFPDGFWVYVAYNPKDHKIYLADTRYGDSTRLWKLDVGLSENISCPTLEPFSYSYAYPPIYSNFEFDSNGNLWSLGFYDSLTGRADLDNINAVTGEIIATKTVQFSNGFYPNTLNSGDISILPNGRMFAVLGYEPSRLYEITNYANGPATEAIGQYLVTTPSLAFGLAYLNGRLEISGSDLLENCYSYDYDIATNNLGVEKQFKPNQSPYDLTSITPTIGATEKLVNTSIINSTTADLTYEIYIMNMGNISVNNINVIEDLGGVFGAANISNVQISFANGYNNGGFTLNNLYNGTTITNLLDNQQKLNNSILQNNDHYFKINIQCRVSNLDSSKTYLNAAIVTGSIGSGNNFILLTDSSNNGTSVDIDINKNGNPNEAGENNPSILNWAQIIPVKFINVNASFINAGSSIVQWTVATPVVNANKFLVEFSTNGINWSSLGTINIVSATQSKYQFTHNNIPSGNIYYRIKQMDDDGTYTYSRIVLLKNSIQNTYAVFPNPANERVQVSIPYNQSGKKILLEIFDALGQRLSQQYTINATTEIDTRKLANGTYWLKITNNKEVSSHKVVVFHR